MVKIIIGNIYSKIFGFLPDKIQKQIDKSLSYRVANAWHMPKVKKKLWDGVMHLFYRSKGQSFYTGLLSLVREILKENKIEFTLVDQRVKPEQNLPNLEFIPPPNFQEREYQDFTIDRSIKFTRGILEMATGSGKTLVVTQIISRIKTYPFIFFVLTKDLMEQAHNVLSGSLNEPIGKIGDGHCDIKKINICTIQTAIKAIKGDKKIKISDYKFDDEDKWDEKGIKGEDNAQRIRDLIENAAGVYFDEVHHSASLTCRDSLSFCKNAYWRFGGSATPYREDNSSILIQGLFASKIVKINASYLIKNNYLVKPYIFFEPIDSNVDLHSYKKIYEHCIEKNDSFNNHVALTARHLISRGLNILILVQHYPQGDYLKDIIPDCKFVTGRMKTKERIDAIQDLRDGKTKAMIATSLGDEGLDITNLDAVLLAGGGKSVVKINQRIGRALRKGDSKREKAIIVVYDHNARFLDKHTKKIRSILKKEKEFVLLDSKGPDFILNEIDDILGIENKQETIFDI